MNSPGNNLVHKAIPEVRAGNWLLANMLPKPLATLTALEAAFIPLPFFIHFKEILQHQPVHHLFLPETLSLPGKPSLVVHGRRAAGTISQSPVKGSNPWHTMKNIATW